MDHLVIQKGRLTQNTNKLNKSEIQEWISFGAQEILKTSSSVGENNSKKDIEKIIEDSLKTFDEKLGNKLKKLEDEFNLQNFTSDTNTR